MNHVENCVENHVKYFKVHVENFKGCTAEKDMT